MLLLFFFFFLFISITSSLPLTTTTTTLAFNCCEYFCTTTTTHRGDDYKGEELPKHFLQLPNHGLQACFVSRCTLAVACSSVVNTHSLIHSFTHSPISLYIDHLLTTFFTVLIRQCTNTATTTTITVHNSHCIQTIFSTLSAAFLLVRGGLPALTAPKWLPGVFLLILLLLLIEPFSYQTRNYYNNNSNNLGNGRHQGKADRHNAGSCRLLLLLLLLSPDFT